MGTRTAIEWTDHSFNPWIGCTKIAPGCTHCYAEALATRFHKAAWGAAGTRIKTAPANWAKPLKWDRDAQAAGRRARVFCASYADVFECWGGPILSHHGRRLYRCADGVDVDFLPAVPHDPLTLDDLRRDLFALIDRTPALDWLLLTKRPERVRDCWPPFFKPWRLHDQHPRPNVWLGTSVSDQATFEAAGRALVKAESLAPVLFLSAEPLLGPLRLRGDGCVRCYGTGRQSDDDAPCRNCFPFHWIIVGGESGHHRRDHADLPAWIASIADQCTAAAVPLFVKQDSHRRPGQRGRLCTAIWNLKQFPDPLRGRPAAAVEAAR